MIVTGLIDKLSSGSTILCIGAHSDDIEIGCGGTIRRIVDQGKDLSIYWVVLSASGDREREARSSAEQLLASIDNSEITISNFRNGFFPYVATEIKEYFESLKRLPTPDLILTHYRGDAHQDHRTVSELTWNTFRDHLILEYEIPKYDGDLGSPNVFVALDEDQISSKKDHLMKFFKSQHGKHWFSENVFESLSRIRGIECSSPTGFAEAFYARKMLL